MKVLITGGTIDKQYNPLNGSLVFNQSSVSDMIERSRTTLNIDLEVLMMKDSLDVNNTDIQLMVDSCNNTEQEHVVITHGTDTIIKSALFISENLKSNKTVVLLGAMIPYQFKDSDAFFNFGCALSAVQTLPHGVYITMNGQIFLPDEVTKNLTKGIFERINV